MFKELDGITTLGLKDRDASGVNMFKNIWNKCYADALQHYIKDHILSNCTYDYQYKIVDDLLKPFIGVYKLNTDCIDVTWRNDFISKLDAWLYRIYYKGTYNNQPIDINQLYKLKSHITGTLYYTSNFNKGTVYNRGHHIKILKFLKQQIKTLLPITDQEFEQLDWYKFYVKKKESNVQLYFVITNSIASQLGMSSYAPALNNDYNSRVWSSCQRIYDHNDSYARCVPSNLTDKGSLICYITDGTFVPFYPCDSYEHHQMMYRWMLRLLKDSDGNPYLALDRAYPNDSMAAPVFDLMLSLSKQHNIPFTIHKFYNNSQEGCYFNYDNLKDLNNIVYAKSFHKIMYSSTKYYCESCNECDHYVTRCPGHCPVNTCDKCDFSNDHYNYFCNRCHHFNEDCLVRDCNTCEYAPEYCINNDDEEIYGYYNDQGSGISPKNYNYATHLYYNDYCICPIKHNASLQHSTFLSKYKFGEKVIAHIGRYYESSNSKNFVGIIVAKSSYKYGIQILNGYNDGSNLNHILPTNTGVWLPEDCISEYTESEAAA